jgi:hypothetical protein
MLETSFPIEVDIVLTDINKLLWDTNTDEIPLIISGIVDCVIWMPPTLNA